MTTDATLEPVQTPAEEVTGDGALVRILDELMAQPIKERPAITVLGHEHVFAINPPKR